MPHKNRTIKHSRLIDDDNCTPKRKFRSEKEALAAAEYQMLINQSLEFAVYKCDRCLMWHLTRSKNTITKQ